MSDRDAAADDPTVTALLAMAEFFLSQRPLPVIEASRCLLGVLALHPVPRLEASVRLRLGLLLSEHTLCVLEAKDHLEKAMLVAGTAANLQGVKFHAASSLAALLLSHGHQHQARGLLRGKLEATVHHPYWHIRLLLQLADLLAHEGDVSGQLSTLSRCADYSLSIGAGHAHLLATLARGAVLLTNRNYSEAGSILNQASNLLETYSGPQPSLLRTFYLTIQVTHLLMAGQVKTAKPHLKQLQQCVQSLSSQPDEGVELNVTSDLSTAGGLSAESFQWLSRPHAYITVYLVSVLHSVQAGFTDKALSYVDRAMQLINQELNTSSTVGSGVLSVLRTHVLEQSVQCLLMRGDTVHAGKQLQEVVETCHSHHMLVYSHRAVLHTLLGLYAFATSSLDRAIAQFQTAMQHTNCKELRVLVSLNLAISYMKVGVDKEVELAALMTSLNSESGSITCQSLQSALSYVRGLYSFTSGRLHDAKKQLRETLTIANSSDLNKLTSCSLLLLGQIFLALGNTKETLDMVSPALQLSVKMPENRLQVWAASLLADLYHTLGEGDKETLLRQQSSSVLQKLERDEKKAIDNKTHQLLQWTNGEWPAAISQHDTTGPTLARERDLEMIAGYKPLAVHETGRVTPPRRNSMTLNGSPVTLKTPEIVLKRIDSPQRSTPPRSLLAMPSKLQTTPTNQSHPVRHVPNKIDGRVSHNPGLQKQSDSNHTPPSHQDTHHTPPSHQDTHHTPPSHQDTHHTPPSHQDTHHTPPSHQDTHHTPPSHQDTHHINPQDHQNALRHPSAYQDIHNLPSHQDIHHPPTSRQIIHYPSVSHQDSLQNQGSEQGSLDKWNPLPPLKRAPNHPPPPGLTPDKHLSSNLHPTQSLVQQGTRRPNHPHSLTHHELPPHHHQTQSFHSISHPLRSPLLHSSPSPRAQSSLSHSPHAYQTLPSSLRTTTHRGQLIHHSNSPCTPPSYEHSVLSQHGMRPHTPPLPAPSTVGPQSPKLHHLSPSHTPPPSRMSAASPHASPAHVDAAVEQHILRTQQQLLWQQIQTRQNHQIMAQGSPYLQPVAPHCNIGQSAGPSPHYMFRSGMSLPPTQLTHMATLQQMSREPNRSYLPGLAHGIPSHSTNPPLYVRPRQLPGEAHLYHPQHR